MDSVGSRKWRLPKISKMVVPLNHPFWIGFPLPCILMGYANLRKPHCKHYKLVGSDRMSTRADVWAWHNRHNHHNHHSRHNRHNPARFTRHSQTPVLVTLCSTNINYGKSPFLPGKLTISINGYLNSKLLNYQGVTFANRARHCPQNNPQASDSETPRGIQKL